MRVLLLLSLCILCATLCQGKQYAVVSNEVSWSCGEFARGVLAKLNADDSIDVFCGVSGVPTDLSQYDGIITWLNGQSDANSKIESVLSKYLVSRRGIVVFASFSLSGGFFSSNFLSTYSPLVQSSPGFYPCFGSAYGTCQIVASASDSVFNVNLPWNEGGYYLSSKVDLATPTSRAELSAYNTYYQQRFIVAATRQLSGGGVTAFINFFPFDNFPDTGVFKLFANALSYPFPKGNVPNCKTYAGLNCKTCETGYSTVDGTACTNINECLSGTACPFGSTCVDTVGSYNCNDFWYFIVNQQTNYTLEQSTATAGSSIVVREKKSVAFQSQLWQITPEGFIVNYVTRFVLDVEANRIFPETPVIGWPRKSPVADNQLWTYNATTGYIQTKSTSLVLDVYFAQTTPESPTILWYYKDLIEFNGAHNQRWDFVLPTTYP